MIKNQEGDAPLLSAFTLYEHFDFNGKSQTFNFGKYNCADFGKLIDKGSSFKVAAGTEVILYQHCFETGDR
jgi:hypothetical protein